MCRLSRFEGGRGGVTRLGIMVSGTQRSCLVRFLLKAWKDPYLIFPSNHMHHTGEYFVVYGLECIGSKEFSGFYNNHLLVV